MSLIRLNKYLAQMGVASRRHVDDLVSQRRILINGKIALLGQKVDPEVDTVTVDKKVIPPAPQTLVYYALNKPKYVLSSSSDDRGRKSVTSFVPATPRVFPVGRLDFESTGLILLTNDGDLALRLTHPRYHLPKVYQVTVLGKITSQKITPMTTGIILEDGKTAPAKVTRPEIADNQYTFEITLFEGKKRQIRRMCAALHLFVLGLHRVSVGPVLIGNLAPGDYRPLTFAEVSQLKKDSRV